MKIVADDKIPFLKGALELFAEVVYLPGKQIERASLEDADAMIIRTRTKCTPSLLKGTKVKFIGTATIGFDHIDTAFCDKNSIKWISAPGCNSSSVQQYIAAALLKMASDFHLNLKDMTIGIVGVGNVGSRVEKLAHFFGMKTLLCDPPRAAKEGQDKFVNLGDVLYESDIVTVHVPLNIVGKNYTYHLFDEKSFKKMKKDSWFLNSSRGEVAETNALKRSLVSGKLSGSVIDVWENEPDIDHDLMAASFISTPHIAGYSTDGKANGTAMIVNSLAGFFGLPLTDWYPDNLPQPLFPEISIDGKGKSDEDILREAVFHTYNIDEDDIKFRFSPSDFEKHRGDYPLRREFPSYRIKLKGGNDKVLKMLNGLGFNVER